MFAFKYFKITRQMPIKLANRKVPKQIVICDHINNGVFLSLNCIAPILTAAFYITGIILEYPVGDWNRVEHFYKMGNISYMITMTLPLITGSYLFVALYYIWRQTSKRNNYQVNVKAMCLHASSFALYMISVLLLVYGMTMQVFSNEFSLVRSLVGSN